MMKMVRMEFKRKLQMMINFDCPHAAQHEGEPEEEIEIEGEKYSAKSSLSKLREGLRICGLPKGRSKEQAWRRLSEHHRQFCRELGSRARPQRVREEKACRRR